MTAPHNLPVIRQSERVDFKRCPKKWFWRWRMGLVPRVQTYGALSLGTWMHSALEMRYTGVEPVTLKRAFDTVAEFARGGIPPDAQDKAEELFTLGSAVSGAYDRHYGDDPDVRAIGAEIPLELDITTEEGKVVAKHRLKPDLLYRDQSDDIWLLENKTAKQIRLDHLVIDDQARGYAAMSEIALRRQGYLKRNENVKGVMYNFLRKIMPDERPQDTQGRYLNKDGSISKKQPLPIFVRHPIVLSNRAKWKALEHIRIEAMIITGTTLALRAKEVSPDRLQKTPHSSCPSLCPFFTMCVVEEQGGNYKAMQRDLFKRENPYTYEQETTDEPKSFELS